MSPIAPRSTTGGAPTGEPAPSPAPDTKPAASPPDVAPAEPPPADVAPAAPAPDTGGTAGSSSAPDILVGELRKENMPDLTQELEAAEAGNFDDFLLHYALFVVLKEGATQKAFKDWLGASSAQANALLKFFEDYGAIGPQRRGKRREVNVKNWKELDALIRADDDDLNPGTEPPMEPAIAPVREPATEPAVEPIAKPEPEPATGEPATEPSTEAAAGTEVAAGTESGEPAEEETPLAPGGLRAKLRGAFAKFASKFRGEVQPEDEAGAKPLGVYARKGALALIGGAATVIGYKGFHDMPAWLWQKFISNPKERKRLLAELKARDEEAEPEAPDAIVERLARVTAAIDSSKFKTQAQKEALRTQLDKIVTEYKDKDASQRQERDEEIAKALDAAIQTRVKGVTALKEGVNSALMLTGFMAVRAGWFGAVSLIERDRKVRRELKAGERKGGYLNEMIVKGFTETAGKLAGGVPAFAKIGVYGTGAGFEWVRSKISKKESEKLDARLKKMAEQGPQALRAMEGAATVMRIAGLGGMAIAEILESGGPSEAIDAALKAMEANMAEKGAFTGVGATLLENLVEAPMRPIHMVGSLYDRFSDAPTEADADAGAGDPDDDADVEPEPDVPGEPGAAGAAPEPVVLVEPGAAAAAGAGAGAAGATAGVEVGATVVEVPEATVTAGLVKKGDGILRVLQRQGVDSKDALEAAREAHIVRAGGDTRLTTQAIGRLSIFTEAKPDGGLEIKFYDTQAATPAQAILTLEEAHDAGFTYEHGAAPTGAAAASVETATTAAPPAGEALPAVDGDFESTPGVPHDLADGRLHIFELDDGTLQVSVETDTLTPEHLTHLDGSLNEAAIAAELTELTERVQTEGALAQSAAQRLVEATAILNKLETKGLGETPEAHFLRGYILWDIEKANQFPPDVFNNEALDAAATNADGYDAGRFTAGATEADRIDSIRVRGLGKVTFEYDKDGVPYVDWLKLAEQAKPFISARVAELLMPDWEEVLKNGIVDASVSDTEVRVAGPILLMLDAIKELEAGGYKAASETDLLREQLAEYLKPRAHLLDGDHPLIQEAIVKSGVVAVGWISAS